MDAFPVDFGFFKPLAAADVNDIWERSKDLGVLLGKGGLYGSVSTQSQVSVSHLPREVH